MKLAYIDESGTESEEGWFLLSAFIIDSDDWRKFDNVDLLIPDEVQETIDYLKELRHPHEGISPERRHKISQSIYELADFIGYNSITTITHLPKATNFCPVEDIYDLNFTFLAERIEYTLEEAETVGVLFVDERDDKSPRQLQELHYDLKNSGTHYAEFNRMIGAAAPLRDDESIPMSLADWTASAIRNHFIRGNPDYYQYVVDNVVKHPMTDMITGSGIKPIPDDAVEYFEYHPENTEF